MDTGSGGFDVSGEAYDRFMGRYSEPLAELFADEAAVIPGQSALDAGCGPGALTGSLADRLGAPAVSTFDPSAEFAEVRAERHPGVDVRTGRLESVPFEDSPFDVALAVGRAAKPIAEVAGISRFTSQHAFARHNGTAPLPVWSGRRPRAERGAGAAVRSGPDSREAGPSAQQVGR